MEASHSYPAQLYSLEAQAPVTCQYVTSNLARLRLARKYDGPCRTRSSAVTPPIPLVMPVITIVFFHCIATSARRSGRYRFKRVETVFEVVAHREVFEHAVAYLASA